MEIYKNFGAVEPGADDRRKTALTDRRQRRLRRSQQPLKLLDGHAGIGENPAECSFGDIATLVNRDRRAASIGMPHDVMATCHAGHLEPGLFQRPDDTLTT
jgi:hypothetical protein